MTLDELYYKEDLSVRSFNFCRKYELLDLASIQAFYQKNKTFLNIQNCGAKSNKELIAICDKYSNMNERQEENWTNPLHISLRKLYSIHLFKKPRFGRDTLDLCKKNKLLSVKHILDFYNENGSFSKLSGITEKSAKELKKISHTYLQKYSNFRKIEILNRSEQLGQLNETERNLVTHFIQINASKLSVRANNALVRLLNSDLNFYNFRSQILSNPAFEVYKIPRVGKKTTVELQDFINSVEAFALKVTTIESVEKVSTLINRLILQSHFPHAELPESVLSSRTTLPTIQNLIDSHLIFQGKKGIIFENGFNIYLDKSTLSLEAMATKIDVSRERVRQMRVEILDTLVEKFGFVNELNDPYLESLSRYSDAPALWIDKNVTDLLNNQFDTRFTDLFMTFLIGVVAADSFALLGPLSDVLVQSENKRKTRHNWRGIYLINNQLLDKVDFSKILNILELKTSKKIKNTIQQNVKDFLEPYVGFSLEYRFEEIAELATKIIHSEFESDVVSIREGQLYLHKNTLKLTYEYAYETLEQIGKPAHANAIAQKAMEINPGYITSADQIRAAMNRSRGFLPIGRSGKFGLKKWEKKDKAFKGGTIREMVTEYLEQYDEPISIEKIAEYVLHYRPKSNQHSIYQNLFLAQHNTYSFYQDMKVGLTSKVYADHFEILKEGDKISPKSWEKQFQNLETFLSTHNRLPYSRSNSADEERLYRWWRIQILNLKRHKLKTDRAEKMAPIAAKYYSGKEPLRRQRRANVGGYRSSKPKKGGADSEQTRLFGDGDF